MKKSLIIFLTFTILLAGQALAYEFCEDGIQDKNLRLISVDDMLKSNSQEWIWEAGETIELEARVENKDDSGKTFILEIVAIDSDEDEIDLAEDEDDLEKEFELSANERKSISIEFEVNEDLEKDEYKLFIKFYEKGDEDDSCTENSEETITIEKIELCEDGTVDEDELEITRIEDEKFDNEDEWEWEVGDEIEISIELENKELEVSDFGVELFLFDEDRNEIELDGDTRDTLTLEENEDDDTKLSFTIPSSIEEGDYTLYVRAESEEDSEICISKKFSSSETITISKPKRRIVLSGPNGPETASQGEEIEYSLTVSNLGKEDEEKVEITIYSRALGIKESVEIENLDSGEERDVSIKATVAENASLEKQKVTFSSNFEYKENLDYYRSTSDEEDDIKLYINVSEIIIPEEPIIAENETEDLNETIIEEPVNTIMTGNVIQETTSKKRNPLPVIIFVLATGAGVAILFYKKPDVSKLKKIKLPKLNLKSSNKTQHTEPIARRRYTAKLSSGEFNF